MSPPFFSIGVPTYNRHDLLKQTLQSILSQEFTDFEVIVGNDYTAETLTCEMLGLSDPRIRIINHPKNLREVGNMNRLLELSEGRYFTWLFDDDLFEPGLLQIAHDSLAETGYPDAFFSSYRLITETTPPSPLSVPLSKPAQFSGTEFLLRYAASRPDIISTCGFYRTEKLRHPIGGFKALSDSTIGLYSEYLLLVSCGLLERLVFTNTPLVAFRTHSGSWGESNTELVKYPPIGRELIVKCAELLCGSRFKAVFRPVLLEICKTHLFTYFHRSVQYELARTRSKLSRAVKYRLRYYWQVYEIWGLYAQLTGMNRRECGSHFLQMLSRYQIFPPNWNDAAPTVAGN